MVGEAYRKIPQYYRGPYGGVSTTVSRYYNVPYSLVDTIVYEIEMHPMYQNDLEEAKDRGGGQVMNEFKEAMLKLRPELYNSRILLDFSYGSNTIDPARPHCFVGEAYLQIPNRPATFSGYWECIGMIADHYGVKRDLVDRVCVGVFELDYYEALNRIEEIV